MSGQPSETRILADQVYGTANQRAQKLAMSLAVSWLISGQQVGKISVPWIVPTTCQQRARTPLCKRSR
jgi:hypothetical protein